MTDQAMPHSREAEEAVIGSILINPEIYNEVSPLFPNSGRDFYIHRIGFIWDAIKSIADRQDPIDFLTISTELNAQGRLEEVGGPAYLTDLLNQVPTTVNAYAYAKIVMQNAVRRNLLMQANKLASNAYDQDKPVEKTLAEADSALAAVTVWTGAKEKGALSASEALAEMDQAITAVANGEGESIPSGLDDLDKKTGGIFPGDMIIIAARPGEGKTALMLSLAANMSIGKPMPSLDGSASVLANPVPTAFFSMEMPRKQLLYRVVSQYTGIPAKKIRDGKLTQDEWDKFYASYETIAGKELYIDDTPGMSVRMLGGKLRKLVSEKGIKVAYVDQMNFMFTEDVDARAPESIKLNSVAHGIKRLSRELDIAILPAHQMNRASEGSNDDPTLADLDQAGDKPADGVWFIRHKFNGEFIQSSWLYVAKCRMGERGRVPVQFFGARTRFENSARPA